MRCTDSKNEPTRKIRSGSSAARRRKKAIRRRRRMIRRMLILLAALCVAATGLFLKMNGKAETYAAEYEASNYNKSIYRGALYSADLCVASENIDLAGTPNTGSLKAAALFDVEGKKVDYAYNIHEKMYPASLTKLMTALVALEKGNLSDTVTVSANADSGKFSYDEQTCGIKEGDTLTLEDLLSGLLIYSGNDNAVAIAEHVGGSVDAFADMMNEKAQEIMATNSHFVNPNGLHDDNHYTTAYDMYLIFNECIKYDKFIEIISADSYTAKVTGADGKTRKIKWEPTNYYALGDAALPKTGTIIGGKTGTTLKAGNCLILLDESADKKQYISIVMGATTKELLYQDMTAIIESIPASESETSTDTESEAESGNAASTESEAEGGNTSGLSEE